MTQRDFETIAHVDYCYLTTTGRRTGRPHEIEIWFGVHHGALWLLSGGGERSDWVRNLLADQRVHVRAGDQGWDGVATTDPDAPEDDPVRRLLAGKYQGWEEGRPLSGWARTALPVEIRPA